MAIRSLAIYVAILWVNFSITLIHSFSHGVLATANVFQLIIDCIGIDSSLI